MAKDERFMWILVFFDLPVKKRTERRTATKFRNGLLKDGYMMLQYSIYARPCKGRERLEKHVKRLKSDLPPQGNIRLLELTDIQFNRMQCIVGKVKEDETNGQRELFVF